jgi:type II secretory pathway pseudopilin PulG
VAVRKSFSMIELMIGVTILVFALTSILASYANAFILSDLSRNISIATNAVRARMEEVKQEPFSDLDSLDGTTFDLTGFAIGDAKGRVEVSNVSGFTNLKEVRIVGCFISRGRIIGEDSNLNGVLDTDMGEDANNNSRLDSPVEAAALITK